MLAEEIAERQLNKADWMPLRREWEDLRHCRSV